MNNIYENEEANDFISSSNKGMGLSVDETQKSNNVAARQEFTQQSVQGGATGTPTTTSIDTSSTFWGDVLEMGTDVLGGSGGASYPRGGGSIPRGSAPSIFSGSSGNIAQILKLFSPYQ